MTEKAHSPSRSEPGISGRESGRGPVHVAIVEGPIPLPAPGFAAGDPGPEGAGGILTFHGVVRGLEDGREIQGLDYETYDPMAEQMLGALAAEAVTRFGLLGFRVTHSRGFVAVGEASLRVEAAGAHRAETLEAMAWYILRMKEDVPIWKKAVPAEDTSGDATAGENES
jgi:molybdopterin synthase catalytic subunit